MTYRKFIAVILAAAVAVTGLTAAPARADDKTAQIVAGVAALAIVGLAISKSKSKHKDRSDYGVTRHRGTTYGYDYGQGYGQGYGHKKHHKKHKSHRRHKKHDQYYGHKPRWNDRQPLPARCHRDGYNRRYGHVSGYGRGCLINHYGGYNALPHDCAIKVRNHNGKRRVLYPQSCLATYGFGPVSRR